MGASKDCDRIARATFASLTPSPSKHLLGTRGSRARMALAPSIVQYGPRPIAFHAQLSPPRPRGPRTRVCRRHLACRHGRATRPRISGAIATACSRSATVQRVCTRAGSSRRLERGPLKAHPSLLPPLPRNACGVNAAADFLQYETVPRSQLLPTAEPRREFAAQVDQRSPDVRYGC